ncbi:hypothetical protein E2C01_084271 [Portunus trituberculatus]|uniref:Uncharacterized protein n=1 Tax=Portunus trituberculatus TaxID=210409 RepID=A0A5B7IUU3_PORTR|nr:hypothetical protein [Portunus trituberculatus]
MTVHLDLASVIVTAVVAGKRLGRGGPVTVETKAFRTPVLEGFMKAGYQLGFSEVDPSDPDQVGECASIYGAVMSKACMRWARVVMMFPYLQYAIYSPTPFI